MYSDFVGLRVLNVHRQDVDYSMSARLAYHGTIIDYLPGCNPLFKVKYDGREFPVWQAKQDLSEVSTYPVSRGIFATV